MNQKENEFLQIMKDFNIPLDLYLLKSICDPLFDIWENHDSIGIFSDNEYRLLQKVKETLFAVGEKHAAHTLTNLINNWARMSNYISRNQRAKARGKRMGKHPTYRSTNPNKQKQQVWSKNDPAKVSHWVNSSPQFNRNSVDNSTNHSINLNNGGEPYNISVTNNIEGQANVIILPVVAGNLVDINTTLTNTGMNPRNLNNLSNELANQSKSSQQSLMDGRNTLQILEKLLC